MYETLLQEAHDEGVEVAYIPLRDRICVEAGREVVDGKLKRKRIKRLFVGFHLTMDALILC
ncbi:MAG: hypothetical protein KGZ57_04465 [Dethiobacter sp.]|nr:hypothetical protein [Dethiobacter sp.]